VRAKNARALAVPALASFGNTKTGSGTKRRAKRLDRASPSLRPRLRIAARCIASIGTRRTARNAADPTWEAAYERKQVCRRMHEGLFVG
jgi:predicted transcriptional regulator